MADRPFCAHLWAACSMRAMPENEKPPAMPVDIYSFNSHRILKVAMQRQYLSRGIGDRVECCSGQTEQ